LNFSPLAPSPLPPHPSTVPRVRPPTGSAAQPTRREPTWYAYCLRFSFTSGYFIYPIAGAVKNVLWRPLTETAAGRRSRLPQQPQVILCLCLFLRLWAPVRRVA
jgi:hypothetical protein